MIWMEIRAHYAALHAQAQAAGVTQQAIAERGGLAGQNSVSRLLTNDKYGPTVEVFVRAVHGLGKPVSQFFIELEQETGGTLAPSVAVDASVFERLGRIEHALETVGVSLSSVPSSLSPASGVVTHNDIERITQPLIEAIVQARTEIIVAQRNAQIATGDGRGESLLSRTAAHRRQTQNLLNHLHQRRRV